ncbi:hypothetical protein [Catellatospora methionotrophica]|uniref:hypothetical protein n=1 Tax=Catellatospora methionotrophica TaxID=121620 RepID=UPI0033E632E8
MDPAITALATLLAVLLGGLLTVRTNDRLWRREHNRQWRDIRISAYNDFLAASRQYVAFALDPTSRIEAAPHPSKPDESMPFFDERGTPYKEKLESAKTAVRLVCEGESAIEASSQVVRRARQIAASRAVHGALTVPHEQFESLWEAEAKFIGAARAELGLPRLSVRPATPSASSDNLA